MMIDFEKQATRMGGDIRYGIATKVDFSAQPYKVAAGICLHPKI
jgi:thioredoxin reductase (NADPH)